MRNLEQEGRARGFQPTQRRPRGTARAPFPAASRCFCFCVFLASVFLCFETKAQLMDSWRSEDPLPGATLMYCCPISAFNWCPRGRAGHRLLSPLPHTGKVKCIRKALEQSLGSASEGGRQGRRERQSRDPPATGWWVRGQITRFLLFPDSLSGLAGGLGRLSG